MKKLFIALLALGLSPGAFATTVSIYNLPAASSANTSDVVPATQGGTTTVKETLAQIGTALGVGACSGQPALTGDVTSTAGSCATTVSKVNGASVPASANCLSSNSGSQLTAGCPEPTVQETGTSYTVDSTWCGSLYVFTSASAVSISLPEITNCQIDFSEQGAGGLTITPSAGDINGSTSAVTVAQNRQITLNYDSTDTNWGAIGATALVSSTGGGSTILYVTSNVTVTGTTPVNVVTFTAAASTQYVVECYLTSSSTAGTVLVQFTGPASPTLVNYGFFGNGGSPPKTAFGSAAGISSTTSQATNSPIILSLENGATSGTVALEVSDDTAGDTAEIYAGSYCRVN